MQKPICVNCRSSFLQAEILPAQNFTIQYKNYVLPLHGSQKNIIQNTINSYINSQGGVIYLSVQDQLCKVQGLALNRKQMDQYTRMVFGLCQQFYPKVMLRNQAVKVQYIPVLSKTGKFLNKYVPKIIVQKGQANRLYTFSFQHDIGNKKVLVETFAFERYQGKIKRFSCYQIQQQIFERALRPVQQKMIFHQGCNPLPFEIIQEVKPLPKKQQIQLQKSKSKSEIKPAKEYSYYYVITNIKRDKIDQLVQNIKQILNRFKEKINFKNLVYQKLESEIFIYGGLEQKQIFLYLHNSLNDKMLNKYGHRSKIFKGFSNLSFQVLTKNQYQFVFESVKVANSYLECKAILNKTQNQDIVVKCKNIQSMKALYDNLRDFRPRICFIK